MNRLYLVGTTADSKRLVLAKSQGAKFGSFVVPITPKLKKIFRELEEGRVENLRGAGSEEEPPADGGRGHRPDTRFERMTGLTGVAAPRRPGGPGGPGQGRSQQGRAAPPPSPPPEPEPPKPVERRPPINSRFAPAQIQALLRQGKTARSVAKAAGAPLEWVRRLMEPILLERMGIVEEMKRATYTQGTRGPLRSCRWAVHRRQPSRPRCPVPRAHLGQRLDRLPPRGQEWRVRFTYEHRGASAPRSGSTTRRRARWSR